MAYKVIILYQLYMPSYFLGTFTEYPFLVVSTVLRKMIIIKWAKKRRINNRNNQPL